jgi:Fe-S-cluster containining protein
MKTFRTKEAMSKQRKKKNDDLPYAMRDKRILEDEETFSFGCHKELPCFTDCCGDVNIMLTPLDVLQLARKLSITTGEFLDKHTLTPITKDLHLPVLVLKMNEDDNKRCSFLNENGCGVYDSRPWACRMYPLGMGLPPAKAGVEPQPIYFLFEDDFCKGRSEKTSWTVSKWLANQGIEERDRLEAGYREIVSHPWFIGGRTLDPRRMEMFHTAFYDLDKFRQFIFSSSFLDRFELADESIEKLRTDDYELLNFAEIWLRFSLFAEPTMNVRESAKNISPERIEELKKKQNIH